MAKLNRQWASLGRWVGCHVLAVKDGADCADAHRSSGLIASILMKEQFLPYPGGIFPAILLLQVDTIVITDVQSPSSWAVHYPLWM